MASPRHLRVVSSGTGELIDDGVYPACPRCEDVQINDLENLERENRKLLRRIKSLEADKQAERETDPRRQEIIELIEHWKKKTNHPRANVKAGDRFDVVKARLTEGYTYEQIKCAIDGIGGFPYVRNAQRTRTGKPGERHDRLGIALGGGEPLERFYNLGIQVRKEDEATKPTTEKSKKRTRLLGGIEPSPAL